MKIQKLLLTPKEVATRLRMNVREVLKASRRRTNRIPSIRINRRVIRYRWSTVEKWLDKQERA